MSVCRMISQKTDGVVFHTLLITSARAGKSPSTAYSAFRMNGFMVSLVNVLLGSTNSIDTHYFMMLT